MIHDELTKCRHCGNRFFRDAHDQWKKLCMDCWRASNGKSSRHESATCASCYELGKQAGTTIVAPTLDKARIRELLQLAHPDKHGGSALAARVTNWLLEQRSAAR